MGGHSPLDSSSFVVEAVAAAAIAACIVLSTAAAADPVTLVSCRSGGYS